MTFKIHDTNDIYCAIGEIIRYSQEWEQAFKILANILNIDCGNINKSSLNRLNNELKEESKINLKDHKNLKMVIRLRNYINHEFFLNDFNGPYQDIEKILNAIEFLIFEATDVVANIIDRLSGDTTKRPTIFDTYQPPENIDLNIIKRICK